MISVVVMMVAGDGDGVVGTTQMMCMAALMTGGRVVRGAVVLAVLTGFCCEVNWVVGVVADRWG